MILLTPADILKVLGRLWSGEELLSGRCRQSWIAELEANRSHVTARKYMSSTTAKLREKWMLIQHLEVGTIRSIWITRRLLICHQEI